jgi:transposase
MVGRCRPRGTAETTHHDDDSDGIDLAKNTFQLHGVDGTGQTVLRKRLNRSRLLEFFANLPACTIGMEACGGAHYWARELTRLGHMVRPMPAQYVKPCVKRSKHDAAKAEVSCEAVQRPSMRFVPIKSEEQQSLLMLHRMRDRLLAEKTASINAIRGHLTEFGIVAAQRARGFGELRAVIADSDDHRLPPRARALLTSEVRHLRELEARIEQLDRELLEQAPHGRGLPAAGRGARGRASDRHRYGGDGRRC